MHDVIHEATEIGDVIFYYTDSELDTIKPRIVSVGIKALIILDSLVTNDIVYLLRHSPLGINLL